MKVKEDLTGKIFGMVTVLSRDLTKIGLPRGSFWICKCQCGNVKSMSRHALIDRAKSCGCLQKAGLKFLPGNTAARNLWIRKYKLRAKQENNIFSLTDEDFFNLCSKDCFYCGDSPVERHSYKRSCHDNVPFLANGIDRIDSNSGYTLENSVPCCTPCNLMKTNKTQDDFLKRIKRIAERHNGTQKS